MTILTKGGLLAACGAAVIVGVRYAPTVGMSPPVCVRQAQTAVCCTPWGVYRYTAPARAQ